MVMMEKMKKGEVAPELKAKLMQLSMELVSEWGSEGKPAKEKEREKSGSRDRKRSGSHQQSSNRSSRSSRRSRSRERNRSKSPRKRSKSRERKRSKSPRKRSTSRDRNRGRKRSTSKDRSRGRDRSRDRSRDRNRRSREKRRRSIDRRRSDEGHDDKEADEAIKKYKNKFPILAATVTAVDAKAAMESSAEAAMANAISTPMMAHPYNIPLIGDGIGSLPMVWPGSGLLPPPTPILPSPFSNNLVFTQQQSQYSHLPQTGMLPPPAPTPTVDFDPPPPAAPKKSNLLKCVPCGFTFKTKKPLLDHIDTVHHKDLYNKYLHKRPKKCYPCEICLLVFTSLTELGEHKLSEVHLTKSSVSGVKEAALSEGVPQQSSARVTQEKKKENKEEEFGKTFCYPCRIKFDSAENLIRHHAGEKHALKEKELYKDEHPPPAQICHVCNIWFTNGHELANHELLLIHKQKREFLARVGLNIDIESGAIHWAAITPDSVDAGRSNAEEIHSYPTTSVNQLQNETSDRQERIRMIDTEQEHQFRMFIRKELEELEERMINRGKIPAREAANRPGPSRVTAQEKGIELAQPRPVKRKREEDRAEGLHQVMEEFLKNWDNTGLFPKELCQRNRTWRHEGTVRGNVRQRIMATAELIREEGDALFRETMAYTKRNHRTLVKGPHVIDRMPERLKQTPKKGPPRRIKGLAQRVRGMAAHVGEVLVRHAEGEEVTEAALVSATKTLELFRNLPFNQ
eukprot:sb/3462423/